MYITQANSATVLGAVKQYLFSKENSVQCNVIDISLQKVTQKHRHAFVPPLLIEDFMKQKHLHLINVLMPLMYTFLLWLRCILGGLN